MATRQEVLEGMTLERLKQLAADNNVTTNGSLKADYVTALASSDEPTDEEIEAETGETIDEESAAGTGAEMERVEDAQATAAEGAEKTELQKNDPEFIRQTFGVEPSDMTGLETDSTPGQVLYEKIEDRPKGIPAPEGEEKREPIPVGAWIMLGHSDAIPAYLQGHLAKVEESVKYLCNGAADDCDFSPRPHYHQSPDATISVRTRDEFSQLLEIDPADAEQIADINAMGRQAVLPIG